MQGSYLIEQFYRLFQGALIFQSVFFGIIFLMTRRKDVLWYALYLLAALIYFFLNATGTFFNIDENIVFESAWYNWLNIPVLILENLFYLLFIRHFFKDIVKSTQVKRVLQFTLQSVPVIFLVYIVLKLLSVNTQIIFYCVNVLSVLPALLIISTVIRNRLPYARLVANGLVCTVAGTLLTVAMIYMGNNGAGFLLAASYPLLFIRLGLLGDMFFYQFALLKKWQAQEKALAVQQINNVLEIEKMKNRISAELHDDIGSTLSGISMYSHLAGQQALAGNTVATSATIGKIREASGEMLSRLKDLVWAFRPGQDTLDALTGRIEDYAVFMAGSRQMQAVITIPEKGTAMKISTEWRHQVFMIAKEIINNAVKYSGGKQLSIAIRLQGNDFTLYIEDDGCGFDPSEVKKGNGLVNIQKRAEGIDASLMIIPKSGKGTAWRLGSKIT